VHNLIEQFLEHLRYERNVSAHTIRNYASDLEQFLQFLTADDKRKAPEISEIDHLTIREWLASLHSGHKSKSSIARKLAALRTFFQFLVREGLLDPDGAPDQPARPEPRRDDRIAQRDFGQARSRRRRRGARWIEAARL